MQIKLNTQCNKNILSAAPLSEIETMVSFFELKYSNQVCKTLFILRALPKYHSNILFPTSSKLTYAYTDVPHVPSVFDQFLICLQILLITLF